LWLLLVAALALGGLAILSYVSRTLQAGRHHDLGWMSQQWLAEHRAAGR
jgi:hypothetical protein